MNKPHDFYRISGELFNLSKAKLIRIAGNLITFHWDDGESTTDCTFRDEAEAKAEFFDIQRRVGTIIEVEAHNAGASCLAAVKEEPSWPLP